MLPFAGGDIPAPHEGDLIPLKMDQNDTIHKGDDVPTMGGMRCPFVGLFVGDDIPQSNRLRRKCDGTFISVVFS